MLLYIFVTTHGHSYSRLLYLVVSSCLFSVVSPHVPKSPHKPLGPRPLRLSPRGFPDALAPRRGLPAETLAPIPIPMAAVATARDVEEVVQKLQSDRARVRDVRTPFITQRQASIAACFLPDQFLLAPQEGVKLLGTWLQGDRAASFCRLLGRNTVRFKPGHGNLTGGQFVHFPYPSHMHLPYSSRMHFPCPSHLPSLADGFIYKSHLTSLADGFTFFVIDGADAICLQPPRGHSSSWRSSTASRRTSRVRSVAPPRALPPGCSALLSSVPKMSSYQVGSDSDDFSY
jgi:hypothetical protein